MKPIPEEVLQRIWELRAYKKLLFEPTEPTGNATSYPELFHPGIRNRDAGPDFFNAKLRVGKTILVGNVELHFAASEWAKHRHDIDPAYDNVILHVVVQNDAPVRHRVTHEPLRTCRMVLPDNLAPFEKGTDTPPLTRKEALQWKEECTALYQRRITEQARALRERLSSESIDNDEGALVRLLLLRYLGAKVNNEAFEQIARALPIRVVRKHTDHPDQLEALYFGTAGLLEDAAVDDYMRHLQEEWTFLRAKYNLPTLGGVVRKLRLRPAAFPHRRLALMAQLHYKHPSIEQQLGAVRTCSEAEKLLAVEPSEYWQYHYDFGKSSAKPLGTISRNTAVVIILNVVMPYLWYLAEANSLGDARKEELLAMARTLPPETNSIVSEARRRGLCIANALESQALLQQIAERAH